MGSSIPAHKRPLFTNHKSPLVEPGDLQFLLAVAVLACLRLIPAGRRPNFLHTISNKLGAIWHMSNLHDARRVRRHLYILFNNRWSPPHIETIIRRQLSLTVWNFLTLNLIPTLDQAQSAALLPVEGMQHLNAARRRGKPALLLGAHVGPYAYPIAAVLLAHGYEVREIGHARPRQGSSWLYRKLYWPRISATCRYMRVIDPLQGAQTELLDVLERKEALFLLPDQLYVAPPDAERSRYLVSVPYLGHTVNLETGGLRLCKRLGAETFTVLPEWRSDGYRVTIAPFPLPTGGSRPDDLAEDLRAFMGLVAQCIYRQPFLWRDLRRADLLPRLGVTAP